MRAFLGGKSWFEDFPLCCISHNIVAETSRPIAIDRDHLTTCQSQMPWGLSFGSGETCDILLSFIFTDVKHPCNWTFVIVHQTPAQAKLRWIHFDCIVDCVKYKTKIGLIKIVPPTCNQVQEYCQSPAVR